MIRRPAVAGQFYPSAPKRLTADVLSHLKEGVTKRPAVGIVSPHAGYMYSGSVAGEVFSRVALPKDLIVLGVNHRGIGSPCALVEQGRWEMPNGDAPIHEELAAALLGESSSLRDDAGAHAFEHSIEVQLPFIQHVRPDFRFVPIALQHVSYDTCAEVGSALARVVRAHDGPVLLVASNDMTHFESKESAEKKDMLAIERILALDPKGLFETVHRHGISMCGVIPTTVMLVAAKELGAKKAELVRYATSGDVTGDYRDVVGYAGVIVE